MADAPPLLYVEDDPLISMAVSMALEDAGFDVVHVMDGKAAVAALADRAIEFCALATDVRLPDVDGWEIAHQARALKPSIPVVYVSGDSAADWSARGVPNSIMVQKPFANAQLVAAITTLLNDAS